MIMALFKINKSRIKTLAAVFGVGMLIGFCIVAVFAAIPSLRHAVSDEIMPRGLWYFMLWWCLAMAMLVVTAMLQVVVHETGHLIGGLLTGYRFVSFRIGSFVIVSENGRPRIRRFSIAGTGGQCLLEPPAGPDDDFPYRIYGAGGVAANLAVSVAAIAVVSRVEMPLFWMALLTMLFISGVYVVVTNGVPLKINGVPNDGYNLMTIGRDAAARRSLWLQLKVNALQGRGERLRDMPDEWFALPEGADYGNYMTVAVAGMAAGRMLEMHDFEGARGVLQRMDASGSGDVEIYRQEVRCELLFVAIVTGGERCRLESLYTPSLRDYVERSSRYMLSRVRLRYAWARLVEHDDAAAAELLARARRMCAVSPSKGDADAEMELIEWIGNIDI